MLTKPVTVSFNIPLCPIAIVLSANILLPAELYPAQILYLGTWEKITAQYPPAINGDLGSEQSGPESSRMMQDGSHLGEAMGAAESKVPYWTASSSMAQWVGLGMG